MSGVSWFGQRGLLAALVAVCALGTSAPAAFADDPGSTGDGTTGATGPTGPGPALDDPPEVPLGPVKPPATLVPGLHTTGSYVARVVATTFAKEVPWGRNREKLAPHAPYGGGPNQLMVLESAEVVRSSRHPGDERLWVRVALPQRPNGSSGWVPADYLQIHRIRYRIHVSLKKRTVQVFQAGKQVRRFRAVVGKPSTPTPTGMFATNENIRQPDPKAFLGTWALHLTAFSDVLDNYGGGPGRVAIHGRAGASLLDPLGTARSHGCIRVDNSDVNWLAAHIEPGTPVHIEDGMGAGNRL